MVKPMYSRHHSYFSAKSLKKNICLLYYNKGVSCYRNSPFLNSSKFVYRVNVRFSGLIYSENQSLLNSIPTIYFRDAQ